MRYDQYILKKKCIISTSIALMIISIGFVLGETINYDTSFETTTINIQEMATANVAKKVGATADAKKIIEVKQTKKEEKKEEVKQVKVDETPKRVWYLPTEQGRITTYPQYGHAAYDITSARGSNEIIYPVASGVISSIYTDNAGALVVTVRHIVDGKYYSSQYAHLSRYANIYVGQEVTPFTPLGWMGTTGYSTGVHLHIALVDCNMFGEGDACSNLNGFFSYAKLRFSQGFHGLGDLIEVPYEWYSR